MSDCDRYSECANAGKVCFKCYDFSLYKPPKQIQGLRAKNTSRKLKTTKGGMQFEQDGANRYSSAVRSGQDAARRQPGSGALAHALGDVITSEELTAAIAEFKERGSITKSGAKSISIKKEWLDKLEQEAARMNRDYYFLPFRFTGEDKDYLVIEYEMLMGYIETIHTLHEDNKRLRGEL
ncbi:hypothetical protein C0431_12835 [bacterium]|nr:hypothetical protein [bacterium]